MEQVHTEDPKILGATVRNLVATATLRPEFVHPWRKKHSGSLKCEVLLT